MNIGYFYSFLHAFLYTIVIKKFCDSGEAWTQIEYFPSQKVYRGHLFMGTLYVDKKTKL